MLLHITHETRYDYAPAVRTAQHLAYLQPRSDARQRLIDHALSVTPTPADLRQQTDVHGNARVLFGIQQAHERLTVLAKSTVETSPWPQPDAPAAAIGWETVRERMRYHRDARFDAASGFAFASPYVPRHDDFAAYARPSFPPGRPLVEAARELCARIHADFRYVTQATDASTPALEALALRRGVCQDFAHVMLGCLRSLGLAARYVSGYLLTEPAAGQARLVGADASHAWVSVYVPPSQQDLPGSWVDLDPTNDRAPGEDYVVLAIGRDYGDVTPLRGVIEGGANHVLGVAVTVERVG